MSLLALLLFCVGALYVLSIIAIALGNWRGTTITIYSLSLTLSLVLLAGALFCLITRAPPEDALLPIGLPWTGAHFRIDALSSFFLVIVNLGTAAASFFAIGYGAHEEAPRRVLPFYPAFLASMNAVLLADDAFAFLMSWEFMSLVSWALVVAHYRVAENVRAGFVYLVMASAGTFALLLAFGVLASISGGFAFAGMRTASSPPLLSALVLVLVLVGAGSKAGLVPLHVWLPLAHPAAPSHVSALMSGVMTKVAVYAFVRVVIDLLGPPMWWWGVIVLLAGAITAVLGVLYALMQSDVKRVLAFSTIENIGLVFIGLGLALAFRANNMPAAAALALTAALFHALNHSIFKSLLFFGSGAIQSATGERSLEHLGGLIHRMPATAFAVLVGIVAISALPPFNGFASEWLTLQAMLLSPDLPQWALKVLVPAAAGLLALATALAAACFVRLYGIAFLGRPRSECAAAAGEIELSSRVAMAILAALCLVIGLVPGAVIDATSGVVQSLIGDHMPAQLGNSWLSIVPVSASRSSYNGLLIFAFVGASTVLAVLAIHYLASRKLRRAPAWDCGFPYPSARAQYGASSFAQPIRRVFATDLFAARERIEMPPPGDIGPARLTVDIRDPIWESIYERIARVIGYAADRLNGLQFLTIRRYLNLVFMTLVVLLLMLALW